jgi:Protein of unknown function (DUF2934)
MAGSTDRGYVARTMSNPEYITSSGNTAGPTQDEIALRAHQIWCEQGCPHGHDVDNWIQAEQELRAAYGRRIPAKEDVIARDTRIQTGDTIYDALADEAPLATRVEESLQGAGRPANRRSKTNLEL